MSFQPPFHPLILWFFCWEKWTYYYSSFDWCDALAFISLCSCEESFSFWKSYLAQSSPCHKQSAVRFKLSLQLGQNIRTSILCICWYCSLKLANSLVLPLEVVINLVASRGTWWVVTLFLLQNLYFTLGIGFRPFHIEEDLKATLPTNSEIHEFWQGYKCFFFFYLTCFQGPV